MSLHRAPSIATRRSFCDFPWQNGTIFNVGNLYARLHEWIKADRSRLEDISEDLILVSRTLAHFILAYRALLGSCPRSRQLRYR